MDYQNAKIYKITDIGYTKMYIGSTTQPLYKRLSIHKSHYKSWKNGKGDKIMSFDLFDEFGVDNCKIELILECPCENREQLRKKEGEHIKNNVCVNKLISGRTRQETQKAYTEDNKDKIKEYYEVNKDKFKEYYEVNKDKIKKYREANKDKIKEYYEVNKDKMKAYQKAYSEAKKKIILNHHNYFTT